MILGLEALNMEYWRMPERPALELCALGADPDAALAVARELHGVAYVTEDLDRPFRSLVRVVTDDATRLDPCSEVGLYVVYRRPVKTHPVNWPRGQATPGRVAIYGMVRRPELSHVECDRHWRDVHAPLALEHHVGMWDYTQLSVVEALRGPAFDGLALCGFASEDDLRQRFYDSPEGKAIIRADIATFADSSRSARRVLAREWIFAGDAREIEQLP